MLISYNWLQKYFDQKLPKASDLADKIIFHSFEVEEVAEKDGDYLMEIKVLPDRAHDCLCHYGIAKEVSALFNLEVKPPISPQLRGEASKLGGSSTSRKLTVKIEDEKLCRRYIGRMIEKIEVKDSSSELKKSLEILEQRSIYNTVDATNYVLFDIGQPLHAFDADKVVGGITVRLAKAGEKITTLDNQEVDLDESILIIADDEGPLAIAGIKGGKKAEVTLETKNLILESANFDPVNIRKTSQKTGIRTEASKRFENELSTEVADYAMDLLTELIIKEAGAAETKIGGKIDVYPQKNIPTPINFEIKEFAERLGVEISVEESVKILESLGIKVETNGEKIKVSPPVERVDLVAKENYVEEVGRIYGYEKITGQIPEKTETDLSRRSEAEVEKRFNLANKIRVVLKTEGFTEVYGYAFTGKGEVELANPLAGDKKFLRTNLEDWLTEKIKVNLSYVLFDNEPVKVFEMGKVFVGDKEETRLCLGIAYRKKIKGQNAKEELEKTWEKIGTKNSGSGDEVSAVQEISFDKLAETAQEVREIKLEELVNKNASYKIVSLYPRIIRDIALWVPAGTQAETVTEIIKNSAGELCVEGPVLFDEFSKDGKTSLAFRLVFQSYEKTLQDTEINEIMEEVNKSLTQKGFTIR